MLIWIQNSSIIYNKIIKNRNISYNSSIFMYGAPTNVAIVFSLQDILYQKSIAVRLEKQTAFYP